MSVPTTAWSLLTPAGAGQINAGDNQIRILKTQINEVIDVDHNFPSSGSSETTGFHNKVTLIEAADIGSGSEGLPILGAQTISDKPELVYTDEDDNDIQITKAGVLKPSTSTVLADWSAIMNLVYPVGSYYFNDSVSTNPATLLGVGTWVAVEERVLVGYKSGSAEFGTAGGEYGSKTTTLTAAQSGLPAHTHNITAYATDGEPGNGVDVAYATPQSDVVTKQNSSAPASEAHTNLQPSRTVYMWRRTS